MSPRAQEEAVRDRHRTLQPRDLQGCGEEHAGVVPCELDTVIGSISGRTPYDVFVKKHGAEGKAFLDALGIVRVPSNQVTLHPFLLGQKYQRAADRAILKKNGITAKKPETNK